MNEEERNLKDGCGVNLELLAKLAHYDVGGFNVDDSMYDSERQQLTIDVILVSRWRRVLIYYLEKLYVKFIKSIYKTSKWLFVDVELDGYLYPFGGYDLSKYWPRKLSIKAGSFFVIIGLKNITSYSEYKKKLGLRKRKCVK